MPKKVWEAWVQSQIKLNRVPEKVPEKVLGSLGAKPSQVQQVPKRRFWRKFRRRSGRLWCRARSADSGQVQQDWRAFNSQKPSLGVWLRSTLQKDL